MASKQIPLFDAHCDTLSRLTLHPDEKLFEAHGQWNLALSARCKPQAQFFAVYWDSKMPLAKYFAKRQRKTFLRNCSMAGDKVALCRTADEAREAASQRRLAAFLSLEGAELIGCSERELEKWHKKGLRMVNLTWNHANGLSGSCAEQPEQGLTEKGRAFVRKCQELGVIVDVSHLSDAGFWDVAELYTQAKKPFIASHSNSRAVFHHPRNLTDEQFHAIMKCHGAVGLNAYARFLGEGQVTTQTLIAHLEHFLSLGGERTVALGGDWDGCGELPAGYTGVWSWANLYETLLRLNYKESLVKDLFYNNLMRTVSRICTM